MKRIVILGCSGAGKSTLARELGSRLGLPVVHLDREFWLPGWVEPDKSAWAARVDALVAGECWVTDGNYQTASGTRFADCDTMIFLDFSRWLCLVRVYRRAWRHLGRSRPDLSEGCPERMPDRAFLRYIWTWRTLRRDKTLKILEAGRGLGKTVHVLRGRADVRRFLAGLRDSRPSVSEASDFLTGRDGCNPSH
ncbi:ATPase AAA [Opitutales bacterium ASA1]|uniref:topology modulation protein n=1 Tax=Congregicoccus parvus TaxID=3081749 RepID=UPI002B30D588|nr:ATPase AAA [Opitutales bacterium ASA1]